MARKQRIDTTKGAISVMTAAMRPLDPPAGIQLAKEARPFFDAILAERAKSEWSESDLIIAVGLARAMAQSELIALKEHRLSDLDDIKQALGLQDLLQRRIVTLRRTLGIDVRSKHGERRDRDKRRDYALSIEDANPLQDDLLARPSIQ
jgi:hypothetical protein